MSLLAIAAVLVFLVTAWFLVRPLRRAPGLAPIAPAQQETAVLRERLLRQLDELEAERRSERIDPQAAQDEQRRLESALEQVKAPQAAVPASQPAARSAFSVAILALGLPLAAVGLYVWQQYAALTLAMSGPAAAAVPPMVLEMVARLEQRLQQQPNDAPGWARLGRAYTVLDRPADAIAAYEKAYKLAPNDQNVLSDYAGLLYARNPESPDAQTVALYQTLHRMLPEHQPALWVLGLAAYRANKPQQALGFWKKLLTLLPPDSPAAESVRHAVQSLESPAH